MFDSQMTGRSTSNVIPMRPARAADALGPPATTVLFVVADDDGLIEVAPVVAALDRKRCFRQVVAHAGDVADAALTRVAPVDHCLGIGGGTHAERTAAALTAVERLATQVRPEIVVVAGEDDVVVAAAMVAVKLRIAVARLGAGLRCWDWTMPDEVNRTVVDRLADTLFTSSADAAANLHDEGVPDGRIYPVGNTRVDMLRRHEATVRTHAAWRAYDAGEHAYTLVMLQRPETVESRERIVAIAGALAG